jgi:hypothetical protein
LIYTGGLNVFVRLNDRVGAIMETSTNMSRGLGHEPYKSCRKKTDQNMRECLDYADGARFNEKPFAFNVLSFGLRFQPGNNEQMRVSAGTNVPYFNNYWGHHFGAVQGDMQMLLGD